MIHKIQNIHAIQLKYMDKPILKTCAINYTIKNVIIPHEKNIYATLLQLYISKLLGFFKMCLYLAYIVEDRCSKMLFTILM